jgi:NAD(P)-dependent dehydrogenase (short-subunit alcohol dehydrogenase family)
VLICRYFKPSDGLEPSTPDLPSRPRRTVATDGKEFAVSGVDQEHGPSWEIDPADWWRVYEVNVLGGHLGCRAVIPDARARPRPDRDHG